MYRGGGLYSSASLTHYYSQTETHNAVPVPKNKPARFLKIYSDLVICVRISFSIMIVHHSSTKLATFQVKSSAIRFIWLFNSLNTVSNEFGLFNQLPGILRFNL